MTTIDLALDRLRSSSPAALSRRGHGRAGAVALVVGGAFSQQFGAATATLLFGRVGPLGAVTLRLGIAAVVLLAVLRPRVRGYSRADWSVVLAFGLALCSMNSLFYEAIQRIPLGACVTLEVLGPLTLSVVSTRRASSWLWASLALIGVALLGRGGLGGLTLLGAALSIAAGAAWAAYIVLSAQTGRRFPRTDGLALSLSVAALLSLPFGIASGGTALVSPVALGAGAVVATGSSILPYSFEMHALRRLGPGSFAILMSLMPAVATVAGRVVLGQRIDILGGLAIGLVVTASAGALRGGSRTNAEHTAAAAVSGDAARGVSQA